MNVIVFGATGMIGQGVLRECLLAADVERVLTIGRSITKQKHDKLLEIAHAELTDYSSIAAQLSGYDACFFCLGVSSSGLSETEYRHVTVDIAVAAARLLAERNPSMTFVFVSGAGADETGRSSVMWARVKGEAEKAILAMPFARKYAFRPAFIRPTHGITSRTPAYRVLYNVLGPLFPVLKAVMPGQVTTTEIVGRAMLNAARYGAPKAVLDTRDINTLATVGAGG